MQPHRPQLVVAEAGALAAPRRRARPKLGQLLCERGKVTEGALARILDLQIVQPARIGELLCHEAGLSEADLLDGLAGQWGIAPVDLLDAPPDPALIARLGVEFCLAHQCVPWRRIGSRTVLATALPDMVEAARADIEARLGPVMLALAGERTLQECIARLCGGHLARLAEDRVAAENSCRGWSGENFRGWLFAGATTLAALSIAAPTTVLLALTLLGFAVLLAVNTLKIVAGWAALRITDARAREMSGAASRQPDEHGDIIDLHAKRPDRQAVVSLLVPLYREAEIAETLVRRLTALRYPPALLDICLVVEADDRVTEAAVARAELPRSMRTIRVPHGALKTKPRALNYALGFCRGSIIGIYDAEDAPEPDQISKVVAHFAAAPPETACLQGRLGFYNAGQNFLSRCFALEYATWFAVLLTGLSRLGLPVPLGGTTLFIRRDGLERLGAWDAHNVTEDADLGIRLHRNGYRTGLIETGTGEEANCRLWPWIRQRSRWIKGYAMTYATHMRDPGRLWRDLGPRDFVAFQVLFLGSLLQAFLAPVLWSWWLMLAGGPHALQALLPASAIVAMIGLLLASEAINIGLALLAAKRTGQGRLAPWALTLNVYSMLASVAAFRALTEMVRKPFFWDKTRHGLFLAEDEPNGTPRDAATPHQHRSERLLRA